MAKRPMKKISEMMKDLDICMLTTFSGRSGSSSRPMSNNGDVEYDGSSYFFTWDKSRMAREIRKNPNVGLTLTGSKRFSKLYISVTARAKLIKDRAKMDEHWNKDLEIWFKDGLDTPGIVMIEAKAKHIKYWHGQEQGEMAL